MPTRPAPTPSSRLLRRVRTELGVTDSLPTSEPEASHPVPLPSRLSTGDLAWASVTAVTSLARIRRTPDPDRIAQAYRSDRVLAVDGTAPDVWSEYSGFWPAADGWVRTHGNYPHHATALLAGLRLPSASSATDVRAAIAQRTVGDSIRSIARAGGLAVAVRPEEPGLDRALRRRPLLDVTHLGPGPLLAPALPAPDGDSPLAGIRVLDLTRVIAGPVCTRTLALLGADVLRIDPPRIPEPTWQHLDTGHGKRSAILDAAAADFRRLLAGADVVVLGYRPGSLDRLGLSPGRLAEQHPGLLIAQLSAWGLDHPHRAGFDSLVQAESGIAMIESPDGATPGALPAQALDHSAGYLLAASILALVERRRREGGTWWVHTSLRRVAAELLGMPRSIHPAPERPLESSTHSVTFRVDGHDVTTARSAIPGVEFSAPRAWGADRPRW